MRRQRKRSPNTLARQYPPSPPCSCQVCIEYCLRPGWWTVEQARLAIAVGYAGRMMLEVSPDRCLGVLSPAFKGCEGWYALKSFSQRGCTFLENERCQLFGTGLQPLECRFCHHERIGQGCRCHADIECDWHRPEGQALVLAWGRKMKLWKNPYEIFNYSSDFIHSRKN